MEEIVCDKCCFCIGLKKGCFIIAYLQLISCVCIAILCICFLIFGGEITTENVPDPRERIELKSLMIDAGITLFLQLCQLIFVVILLVGLHMNEPNLVKGYLNFVYLNLMISIVKFIWFIVSGKADGIDVVINLIYFLLTIYILIVVWSQHQVMITLEPGPTMNDAA